VTEPSGNDAEQLTTNLLGGVNTSNLADVLSVATKMATGKPTLEFHQGIVLSWNSSTGENRIWVLGQVVEDIPSVATGDNVLLFEGDTVALLRHKYNYFVLGRVTPTGTGGSLGLRAASTGPQITVSDTSYSTSVFEPVISDMRIGSSSRALVFVRAHISIVGGEGYVGIRAIGPSGGTVDHDLLMLGTSSETVTNRGLLSGVFMYDPNVGLSLESGVNEIGLVYRVSDLGTAGATYQVGSRQVIVTPY
jgi:hypothetical protein